MLYLLYMFLKNVVTPNFTGFMSAITEPIAVILITLVGIIMLFSVIGVRVSVGLGSTIVGGVFRAIGYVVRTTISGIGWCIRHFVVFIPVFYVGARRTFNGMGVRNTFVSNLLAVVSTCMLIAVII